jgi:hypothetical protein
MRRNRPFASEDGQVAVSSSMSAAFSLIVIDGALVLPDVSVGMIIAYRELLTVVVVGATVLGEKLTPTHPLEGADRCRILLHAWVHRPVTGQDGARKSPAWTAARRVAECSKHNRLDYLGRHRGGRDIGSGDLPRSAGYCQPHQSGRISLVLDVPHRGDQRGNVDKGGAIGG